MRNGFLELLDATLRRDFIARAARRAEHRLALRENRAARTYPAFLPSRHPDDQGIVGHVVGYHRTRAHEGVFSNGGSTDDGRIGAERRSAFDQGLLIFAAPVDVA